uniref:Cytochrome P450 n=1 Tax=Chenopodium quinoa TaxID=63459 RepID=A0A803MRV3_CHEQI
MNKKGKDGKEFRQLIADVAEIISEFSISDLYPSLMFISTITGMKGKLQGIVKRFDKLMDPIIKDHISTNRYGKDQKEDLVDILLKFHKDELHLGTEFSLTTDSIKAIVFILEKVTLTLSCTWDNSKFNLMRYKLCFSRRETGNYPPGMGLGIAIVELVLAMLLYHFNWELPYGSSPEDLDMDETFGIVVRKKVELQVIPVHYSLSGFK